MTKARIIDRAINGLSLDGQDVCRVNRRQGYLTYRHVWPQNTDGRVWDGVRRAAWKLAQQMADEQGRAIEIYTSRGDLCDQVEPS